MSFVYSSYISDETYFLEILNRSFQNFSKILKKCFLDITCMIMSADCTWWKGSHADETIILLTQYFWLRQTYLLTLRFLFIFRYRYVNTRKKSTHYKQKYRHYFYSKGLLTFLSIILDKSMILYNIHYFIDIKYECKLSSTTYS